MTDIGETVEYYPDGKGGYIGVVSGTPAIGGTGVFSSRSGVVNGTPTIGATVTYSRRNGKLIGRIGKPNYYGGGYIMIPSDSTVTVWDGENDVPIGTYNTNGQPYATSYDNDGNMWVLTYRWPWCVKISRCPQNANPEIIPYATSSGLIALGWWEDSQVVNAVDLTAITDIDYAQSIACDHNNVIWVGSSFKPTGNAIVGWPARSPIHRTDYYNGLVPETYYVVYSNVEPPQSSGAAIYNPVSRKVFFAFNYAENYGDQASHYPFTILDPDTHAVSLSPYEDAASFYVGLELDSLGNMYSYGQGHIMKFNPDGTVADRTSISVPDYNASFCLRKDPAGLTPDKLYVFFQVYYQNQVYQAGYINVYDSSNLELLQHFPCTLPKFNRLGYDAKNDCLWGLGSEADDMTHFNSVISKGMFDEDGLLTNFSFVRELFSSNKVIDAYEGPASTHTVLCANVSISVPVDLDNEAVYISWRNGVPGGCPIYATAWWGVSYVHATIEVGPNSFSTYFFDWDGSLNDTYAVCIELVERGMFAGLTPGSTTTLTMTVTSWNNDYIKVPNMYAVHVNERKIPGSHQAVNQWTQYHPCQ